MNVQKYWNNDLKDNKANKLTYVIFLIYLVLLSWIILFKLNVSFSYMGKRSINFIPYIEPLISNDKINFGEIILNVLIFIPLGLYAGVLYKSWSVGKKIFLFFLTSLVFEVIQFIFGIGTFDITDLINNTLGGVIGLMIFKGIDKIFKNSLKAQKFINIIATIGTVLIISLLILLRLNMLPVRYQ